MPEISELFTAVRRTNISPRARIILLGGGTGNPFFTTDTTAVLRAAEIGAQAVLKATNVDGVYSADPKKDPKAKRFDRLTHSQAIAGGYKVMDATAFALARETSLPIIVFSIAEPGSIGGDSARYRTRHGRRRLTPTPLGVDNRFLEKGESSWPYLVLTSTK